MGIKQWGEDGTYISRHWNMAITNAEAEKKSFGRRKFASMTDETMETMQTAARTTDTRTNNFVLISICKSNRASPSITSKSLEFVVPVALSTLIIVVSALNPSEYIVGAMEGAKVTEVGDTDGCPDGLSEGSCDGLVEGCSDGPSVGSSVGMSVVGSNVGLLDGSGEGVGSEVVGAVVVVALTSEHVAMQGQYASSVQQV